MTVRNIVEIDAEKCNGCGDCIPQCHEGALQIVDGKATLVKDSYCDGLGACLGSCPRDAIRVTEREADEFNPDAVAAARKQPDAPQACPAMAGFDQAGSLDAAGPDWPIQLALVPTRAASFEDGDVLLVADCVAPVLRERSGRLLDGKRVLIACPKLDNTLGHVKKLAAILRENRVRSVTVARMEVPCCGALAMMARHAVESCGRKMPLETFTVTIDGEFTEDGGRAAANREEHAPAHEKRVPAHNTTGAE